MRITNLHLIVSFLFLSGVGLFAYQFLVRPQLASLPPLPSIHIPAEPVAEDSRHDEAADLLQAARRKAEASLQNATTALEAARDEGRDSAATVLTFEEARRLFAAARTAEDYLDARALAEQALQQAAETRPRPLATYVVRRGDNLWNISKRADVYGRGAGWVRIWRANEDKIPDFDLLTSGLELTIPR